MPTRSIRVWRGSGLRQEQLLVGHVVAYGYGPNLTGTGYGTSTAPGYLRGAVMNGSTDSWDVNGNKVPDTQLGERSATGRFLRGPERQRGLRRRVLHGRLLHRRDAFYGLQIGCNSGSYDYCKSRTSTGAGGYDGKRGLLGSDERRREKRELPDGQGHRISGLQRRATRARRAACGRGKG